MTSTVRQYYEIPGAPMITSVTAPEITSAWMTHRERLRSWLRRLPHHEWERSTRCSEWCISELVEHLISGSQFLGYTLHQSKKGNPTMLLADFDPQQTPGAGASQFRGLGPQELLDALDQADRRVAAEIADCSGDDWNAPAEAPPGRVPAQLSLNHFLFDSWVHERDLLVPAGEVPPIEKGEAAGVVSYVVALAGVARFATDDRTRPSISFDVEATDAGLSLRADSDGMTTRVTVGRHPGAALRVIGTAGDLVDFATGRDSGDRLHGAPPALNFLRHLAVVMG